MVKQNILGRCKGRFFSLAGRICLINSVLSSIPSFYISIYTLHFASRFGVWLPIRVVRGRKFSSVNTKDGEACKSKGSMLRIPTYYKVDFKPNSTP